jgi:diguanylate cyclase (GGDEF)-like protein/PAS domain S-box-containing protein
MKAVSSALTRLRHSRIGQRMAPWFEAYRADEPVAGTFRARQLHAVLRLTPLTMGANALNVLLIVSAFWPQAQHRSFLVLWGLAVGAVLLRGLRLWWRLRHSAPRPSASLRSLHRATLHAAVLAGLWALMPMLLFHGADGSQQLLVIAITTGMMCAGGFALATVPAAGTAYVLVMAFGGGVALFSADLPLARTLATLLCIYGLIVIASVWATARLFGARLMAEAEAERQNEVIGLLLRDFEENASDVLWEVDAEGRLCHVSPRLAALFGMPVEQLTAAPVMGVLERLTPDDEDARADLDTVRRHMQGRTPFRDLSMALQRGSRTRWWTLSAKPLFDAQGQCTGWRGVGTDTTEAQHAQRRLTWLAHFDPLTGLANRHQFRSQLAELLEPAMGGPNSCAVLCLDLDHFKTINDTLGHAIGDALLQEVARRLLACTRRSDMVARLGGDEFAVILRDLSGAEEAEQLTRRLLEGLQAPCEVQGARIAVQASIGVAMSPRDGTDIDPLLNHADLALYAAKSAGRGEFRFFSPQMATLTRRRILVEQALRGALERGELTLAFQPQLDMTLWRVTGFEALLRWRHPELGEVQPAEFVLVAEEAGLIAPIGEWVIEQACREAVRWPADLTVSVNVSPAQAISHDMLRIVQTALQRTGLAPQRLELEITESVFLHETQGTMQVLRALREIGVRIALDDFGTGYSSLAYLRRFPFDTLKIDRSFVRELMTRRDARAIVKMIIGLAQTLRMRTVAEGVEEPAQASVLASYGCLELQGHLVARAMPVGAVAAFLAAWSTQARPPHVDVPPTAAMPVAPSVWATLPP